MEVAERNRKIKSVLTAAFGAGKVSVKGSRGTAYGWVHINIAYASKDAEERDQLKAKVWELFKAAKIEIDTYGYDDPGSDYGYGSKMHLNFEQCRDVFNEGETVTWNGRTGTVKDRSYSKGGDWYDVLMVDTGEVSFGPTYPDLGAGVAKYRRKANLVGSVMEMLPNDRRAYADAIEKAIRAKHRTLHMRPTPSETAGEPIGARRLTWLNSQLLAYPAKERAARTPAQWKAMYDAAMANKV